MLTVQQVGTDILGGTPKAFYIFGGLEYGIKEKYIEILAKHYGNLIECPNVQEVINMMSKKHIVPLKPAVYVIRYDEAFASALSDALAEKVKHLNVVGTIVVIYENSKHVTKMDKYLSDHTVSIDAVSPQFVFKYLRSDFPQLPERFINIAISATSSYGQAKNMCRCMNMASANKLSGMSDSEIVSMFGCVNTSTESQVRLGVASRNFKYLITVADKYADDTDRILYCVLQTMIELDKCLDNSYGQSDVKKYIKQWTREDVYYMFMHTYQELKKLRSMSSYDVQNSLMYLFGLLQFAKIPSLEVME